MTVWICSKTPAIEAFATCSVETIWPLSTACTQGNPQSDRPIKVKMGGNGSQTGMRTGVRPGGLE